MRINNQTFIWLWVTIISLLILSPATGYACRSFDELGITACVTLFSSAYVNLPECKTYHIRNHRQTRFSRGIQTISYFKIMKHW